MTLDAGFFNFYNHNFVRLAAAIPRVRVAHPAFNAAETIGLLREAGEPPFRSSDLRATRATTFFTRRPL